MILTVLPTTTNSKRSREDAEEGTKRTPQKSWKEVEIEARREARKRTKEDPKAGRRARSLLYNAEQDASLMMKLCHGKLSVKDAMGLGLRDIMSEEDRARIEERRRKAVAEEKGLEGAPVDEDAVTDLYRCSLCGERRTTFYQKQIRSPDEPMTTFITCVFKKKDGKLCNNRWSEG